MYQLSQLQFYNCVAWMSTGFLGGSVVKNPPANAGDVGSIPGWFLSCGIEIKQTQVCRLASALTVCVCFRKLICSSHSFLGCELRLTKILSDIFFRSTLYKCAPTYAGDRPNWSRPVVLSWVNSVPSRDIWRYGDILECHSCGNCY